MSRNGSGVRFLGGFFFFIPTTSKQCNNMFMNYIMLGFGFVTFADPSKIEAVLANCPHSLDGRTIDPKACNPRSMQKPKKSNGYPKVIRKNYFY